MSIILSSLVKELEENKIDEYIEKYSIPEDSFDVIFFCPDYEGCFTSNLKDIRFYGGFENNKLQFVVPDNSDGFRDETLFYKAFPLHPSYLGPDKTVFDYKGMNDYQWLLEQGHVPGTNLTITSKGHTTYVAPVPVQPSKIEVIPMVSPDFINKTQVDEDALFSKLGNDFLSYPDYVNCVFRNIKSESDRKAIYELLKFFESNRSALGMLSKVQNDDFFLSVLVNDFDVIKPHVEKLIDAKDFKNDIVVPETKFELKTLNQGSKTMAAISQFRNDQESPYISVGPKTMTSDEVFVNIFSKDLQLVPVVGNTSHIEHALATEIVHDLVTKQIKETEGDEVAEKCGAKSVILSQLDEKIINRLGDVSISTYTENDLDITLRFKSQIDNQVVIVPKYTMRYLPYRCSFGQPNYYKVLYSLILDEKFKKEFEKTRAIEQRSNKSRFKEGEQFLTELHKRRNEYIVLEDGEPVCSKLARGRYNGTRVDANIQSICDDLNVIKKCSIADRSAFTRLHKIFSMSFNETFEGRVINDHMAKDKQVWLNDASEYVRVGYVPLNKRGDRSRPPQFFGDDVATHPNTWKEYDIKEKEIVFSLDYTSKAVVIHYLSSYTSDDDMVKARKGQAKEDKRSKVYVDSTTPSDIAMQGTYIDLLYKQMTKEKKGWRLGVIVPFSIFSIVRRKYPMRLVTLAPYPFVNSFFVILCASEDTIAINNEYIEFLLKVKCVASLCYTNAYTYGFTDLCKLTKFKARTYSDDMSVQWLAMAKERYIALNHKKNYGALVQARGTDPKAAGLKSILRDTTLKEVNEMNMALEKNDDNSVGDVKYDENDDFQNYLGAYVNKKAQELK